MGMAASQVRLLQLTSRKNDIGCQLENLSMQKTALTRDAQKVTKKYQEALNSKVLKWSNNAGVSYVDLSYSNLMKPNTANQNTPYLITDSNGKVVLDSKYEDYAKLISPNGAAGGDWTSNRTAILSSLTRISEETINNSVSTSTARTEAEEKFDKLQNEVDTAKKAAQESGIESKFLELFGSSPEGVNNGKKTSASTIAEDFSNKNIAWILGTDASSAESKINSIIDGISSSVCAYLDDSDAEKFKEACTTTKSEYKNNISTAGDTDSSATVNVSKDTSGDANGNYVANAQLLVRAILDNYKNAGGSTTTESGTPKYIWYNKSSKNWETYQTKLAELETAESDLSSATNTDNQALTSTEETQIKFYDQLFSAIAEKGWTANYQVEDTDYLNNMLQNNQYYITTMSQETDDEGKSYYEYSDDIASNYDNVYSVSDSAAQKEAETEYEYEKSVINEKESRIDTRMQNLETEQSAINEMIKGIETVRNDNEDRTFGIFA